MLISMAVVETVVLLVIFFFFTEMYENRYGQYSHIKDSFLEITKTMENQGPVIENSEFPQKS